MGDTDLVKVMLTVQEPIMRLLSRTNKTVLEGLKQIHFIFHSFMSVVELQRGNAALLIERNVEMPDTGI